MSSTNRFGEILEKARAELKDSRKEYNKATQKLERIKRQSLNASCTVEANRGGEDELEELEATKAVREATGRKNNAKHTMLWIACECMKVACEVVMSGDVEKSEALRDLAKQIQMGVAKEEWEWIQKEKEVIKDMDPPALRAYLESKLGKLTAPKTLEEVLAAADGTCSDVNPGQQEESAEVVEADGVSGDAQADT